MPGRAWTPEEKIQIVLESMNTNISLVQVNLLLPGKMQKTAVERFYEKRIARLLTLMGQQETVKRFISRYGKQSTKTAYLYRLELYLRWLKEQKGILQTPDELIRDNLMCVFNSEPSIAKITNQNFPIGEGCYARLLEINATWQPDTQLSEIQEMLTTKRAFVMSQVAQVSSGSGE